jgi:hypothetical protein
MYELLLENVPATGLPKNIERASRICLTLVQIGSGGIWDAWHEYAHQAKKKCFKRCKRGAAVQVEAGLQPKPWVELMLI